MAVDYAPAMLLRLKSSEPNRKCQTYGKVCRKKIYSNQQSGGRSNNNTNPLGKPTTSNKPPSSSSRRTHTT